LRILAIDPSLSSTGLALPDRSTRALRPKKLDGAARLCWLREQLVQVVREVRPDVVMLEGYSFGSKQGSHQIGEWGGVLRLALWEMDLPVVLVPPFNLKQWVTGHGHSDKKNVKQSILERSGRTFPTEDEGEAFALGDMAYAYIGQPGMAIPVAHRDAWAKIEWTPAMVQAHVRSGL